MATQTASKTKKPTPLSTRALAAFLTWKQFDLLLLLNQSYLAGEAVETLSTAELSAEIEEIKEYDVRHGGAFYGGVSWNSCYSCLRSLERRQLVERFYETDNIYSWVITNRGRKALEGLETNV